MKKIIPEFIEIPCIVIEQNGHKMYSFSEDAKNMWKVLSINRRVEDKDEGYQRTLSQSRVNSISKYIDNNNTIPQSLLVSFDNGKLIEKGGIKYLQIEKKADAGWVIDGQHRLVGAYKAKKNIDLAFIAFLNLEIAEQIQLFININQLAKGVPSSLYLDLLKSFPNKTPQEQAKERVADIASELKRDEDSPFYARIVVTTAPKIGELSLTNFVRKVTPLIQPGKGIFASYTEMEQRSILSNYYKGLRNIFPSEFNKRDSIFFQTLGFGALMNALPTFFSLCLKEYSGFTLEDTTATFKKIDYFDFALWKSKGTGSAAEIEAGNDLSAELNTIFEVGNKTGGSIRL
jgi:DGQHR domain-containing protein